MTQVIEFTFPSNISEFEEAGSLNDVQDRISSHKQLMSSNMEQIRYCSSIQKSKYAYFRCAWSGCHACLSYTIQQNGKMKLKKLKCFHRHDVNLRRGLHFKFNAVQSYIQSLPLSIAPAALKKILCPQFAITEKQFYYVFAKSKGKKQTTDELIRQLEEKGF